MHATMETQAQAKPVIPPQTTAPQRKSMPVLMPERFGLAEDMRHDFVANIPMGVTLEDVLEPSYWAHMAEMMVPLDHIEVRAEDGSWVAFLIVQFCERNYARVVLDRIVKMSPDTEVPVASIKHRVEWKGPQLKYCVIRVADSQILKREVKTKEEANAWLLEHERTVGR